MHIIHVSSELATVAKAGGIGDVIYGLAKAQIELGHKIEIVLPKYDTLLEENLTNLRIEERDIWVEEAGERFNNTIWRAECQNLSLILIESHHRHNYFSRGHIYGSDDDIERFTTFSHIAISYFAQKKIAPDALHIHDWLTALIAPLYKEVFAPKGLSIPSLVMTIHNLQYQGKCSPYHLKRVGLSEKKLLTPEKLQDPSDPYQINLLKGGIVYADALSTVSPTFEKEIRTPLGGFGLSDTLESAHSKLRGILNGLDPDYWNPLTDPHLSHNYPQEFPKLLEGKKTNKKALQKRLGLEESTAPLVASVTRMVSQKGPQQILDAIERTIEKGGQYVLLGSLPEENLLDAFKKLRKKVSGKQFYTHFEHDEELAHQVYAGADILVVPSIFEPCGLTQMIAMSYGTVPVARKTGGLADTVFDVDTSKEPEEERNGYTFDFPDRHGVYWALDRALQCCENEHEKWHSIIKRGVTQDLSWNHTAPEYIKLYELGASLAK